MTTCPRCGQTSRPGTPVCPRCGTPLAVPGSGGLGGPGAGQPDWLRQLQSGQLPGGAAGPAPAFPPNGLPSNGFPPAAGPQGFPQPGQPRSFPAASLLSDDALPGWLRGAASGAPAGQAYPAPAPAPAPAAQQAPQGWGVAGADEFLQAAPFGQAPVGQPPAPPVRDRMSAPLQPGTPASALFDESALPDWLRQASGGQDVAQQPTTYQPAPAMRPAAGAIGMPPAYTSAAGMGGYPAQPAPQAQPQLQQRPAAFPSIEQVGAYGAPAPVSSALSGPALIDPSSLPAWLGGQAAPPSRSGGVHSTGMPAQALIDESALPAWLRAEPQAGSQAPSAVPVPVPAAPPAPGSGRLQWAPPTVDEPLPSWLNQVYADANVPRIGTGSVGGDPWSAQAAPFGAATGPTVPDSRRLAASSLMDDTALPDWLKIQGAQDVQGTQSAGQVNPPSSAGLGSWQVNPQPDRAAPRYVPGGGQSIGLGANMGGSPGQFAASDLIDPDAVPSWVRGDAPQQQASFSSTLGWTSKQPSVSPGSAGLRGANNPPASDMLNLNASQQPGTGGFYSGMLTEEMVSPWSSRPLDGQSGGPGRGQSDQLMYGQGGQLGGGYGSGSLQSQQGHRVPREYDHSGPLPEEFADRLPRGSGNLGAPARGYAGTQLDESAENAARRHGPPIPLEELPPWLRSGTDARGAPEGYGTGAEYGDNFQGDGDEEWWPEDEEQEPQWNDWGDEGAGAEYGGEYPGYPGYSDYAQGYDDERAYRDGEDRKRGGWRRLFGRR